MMSRSVGLRVLRSVLNVGFSRHTALPSLRRNLAAVGGVASTSIVRRLLSLLSGSSMIGVAVALLVHADLGLPPYDVMSSAISERFGISLGQSGLAMAAGLFVVAVCLGRRPSLWGIGYIVANGIAIDAAGGLLTQPDTLVGRWIFVLSAVPILAGGVSLVVFSGTTGGPFELLTLAGEDRGIDRTKIRYGLDVGVFSTGVILGGSFGPATVFFALTFGLVLRVMGQALIDHRSGRDARIEQLRSCDDSDGLRSESKYEQAKSAGSTRSFGRRRRQPVA